MSGTEYTVARNDTLGSIAKRTGRTVEEVAAANGIRDPNKISVGQKIVIPGKPKNGASEKTPPTPPTGGGESWSQTVMKFVDSLGRPIANMKVRLEAEGRELLATTNASGCVPLISCEKPGSLIDIFVTRAKHKGEGEKKVASYEPMAGKQTAKVQSGKQLEQTPIRKHEGKPTQPPKTMPKQPPGTKDQTRNEKGNPLTCVKGCECPNDDNLRLGPNAEFREHVKAAAARMGVSPQAVAAVMKAEAAKDKDGKWRADSETSRSSATGMTQFLDDSWLDVALRNGTYLNDEAKAKGWLSTDAKGRQQFKNADGTFASEPNLVRKLMKTSTGRRTSSDANVQALLNMRYEAKAAIFTAMDYAKLNLNQLNKKGHDTSSLNDVEKARIIYLCHHLGLGDAVNFINNTITDDSAKKLLSAQMDEKVAEKKYVKTNGDSWIKGHRAWLESFMGTHITLSEFTCPSDRQKKYAEQEKSAPLTTITDKLKASQK